MPYATVAEARARGLGTTTVPLDSDLEGWLEDASRVVDDYTGTAFGVTVPTTRTFYGVSERFLDIAGPVSGVTSITADGVVIAASAYRVEGTKIDLGSYGSPNRVVAVTGRFGYPDIPSRVRLATIYIADTLISQSQYRPVVGTDSDGNPLGLPQAGYVPRLPSNGINSTGTIRADRLLRRYRRGGVSSALVG